MPQGKKNKNPAARSIERRRRVRAESPFKKPPHTNQFEAGKIYRQESKGEVTKFYKANKAGTLVRVIDPNQDKQCHT